MTPLVRQVTASESPTKLLWTSGWDSTYRLLDLVLVHKKRVQPYYFLLKRHSGEIERERMELIKDRLFATYPAARELVLETVFVSVDDVPPDEDAWLALCRLRAAGGDRPIGGQYYDFGAAAKHLDLYDLELGLHSEEGAFWYDRLVSNVAKSDGSYRLVPRPNPPELEIFRRFSFPLLKLSKMEMARRAKLAGFENLLELTWFCHRPDRKGRACGLCAPCRLTMEQGLSRRIPRINRMRQRLLWPVILMLSRHGVRRRARTSWKRLRRLLKKGRLLPS